MSEYTPPAGTTFGPGKKAASATEYKPPSEGLTFGPGKKVTPKPAPPAKDEPVDPQGGLVKAWSASVLDKFEECPHRVYLSKVEKHPEPSSPAADRGSQIHKAAEDFVQGYTGECADELKHFKGTLETLREQFAEGIVEVEQNWAYNVNWGITEWMAKDIWARIKLDVFVRENDFSGRVIDWKTGKKWGNEIKHGAQGQIYALGAFMRYPELQYVETMFAYTDKNDVLESRYTRQQMRILQPRIEARAIKLTSAKEFHPKPSQRNCRFCPHAETGNCGYAYKG